MIRELFFQAVQRYTADESLILSLWTDIEKRYSASGRHYHNLAHLDNLAKELFPLKDRFSDWDAVVFSIVYHDVIYKRSHDFQRGHFKALKGA